MKLIASGFWFFSLIFEIFSDSFAKISCDLKSLKLDFFDEISFETKSYPWIKMRATMKGLFGNKGFPIILVLVIVYWSNPTAFQVLLVCFSTLIDVREFVKNVRKRLISSSLKLGKNRGLKWKTVYSAAWNPLNRAAENGENTLISEVRSSTKNCGEIGRRHQKKRRAIVKHTPT